MLGALGGFGAVWSVVGAGVLLAHWHVLGADGQVVLAPRRRRPRQRRRRAHPRAMALLLGWGLY